MANEQLTQAVMDKLVSMIGEIVGQDWIEDLEISAKTTFNSDLELESIEFVALAEKLQAAYGDTVDFVGWLSGKDLDEIIGLTVGQVVEFIVECQTSK
jgi:acyl carrier protein